MHVEWHTKHHVYFQMRKLLYVFISAVFVLLLIKILLPKNKCLFIYLYFICLFIYLFIYLFIEWFISSLIFFLQLFITSSFRKHIPSGGSSRSNHMAGRAIDLNLSSPGGFCNKSCMGNEISLLSRAKCFISKIRNDRSLRWGGDFNDPGHIDDNLNNRDRATYNRLRNRLQPICRKP